MPSLENCGGGLNIRVSYRIFLLGGGNVFSHASMKHGNVGGSGGIPPPPQEKFFKLSFSEVDFSAILLCVHVYTAMHYFSNAVKSCRCECE